MIYDIFYIYFWPFIAASWASWLVSKRSFRYVKAQLRIPSLHLLTQRTIVDGKTGIIATVTAEATQTKSSPSLTSKLLKPITRFPLLWAVLILTDSEQISLAVLSAIALFGAARALIALWNLRVETQSLKSNFKAKFAEQLRLKIDLVLNWQEKSDHKDVINELNALKLYEAVFAFLEDNRQFLNNCTTVMSIAITAPFYAYVSALFSLTYFGISKIQGIPWDWPSAFSVSLFMPFAYTDLPHSFAIRVLGGIQGLVVGFMSWNILSKHLTVHFEKLVDAAVELRRPFVNQAYLDKVQRLTVVHKSSQNTSEKIPAKAVRVGGSRKKHLSGG